jgi:hypothetical protein
VLGLELVAAVDVERRGRLVRACGLRSLSNIINRQEHQPRTVPSRRT